MVEKHTLQHARRVLWSPPRLQRRGSIHEIVYPPIGIMCYCTIREITDSFLSERQDIFTKVIAAEVKFTAFLLEHNLPIATADHAGLLFRSMFPDSKVASYYMHLCELRPQASLMELLPQKFLALTGWLRHVPRLKPGASQK